MAKGRSFFDSFSYEDSEQLPVTPNLSKLDEDDPDRVEDVSKVTSAAEDMEYADDDIDNEEGKTPSIEEDDKEDTASRSEEVTEKNTPEDIEEDGEWLANVVNPLAEEGVLYYDPEKEYSPGEEGFVEVIEDTIAKRWEEKVSAIPEEYRSIIDHLAAGKPLDEWRENMQQFDYSSIDMDDEDNQRMLIAETMELQGFEQEDIEGRLAVLEDAGTAALKKEAEIAQKYMVKHTERSRKDYEASVKAQALAQQAKEQAKQEKLRADIFAMDELAGFKLDKRTKEKLYDHITKPVGKTGKTQMMLNREDPQKQLLAAYLDMVDYRFEDVQKKVETKVTRGLKAALNSFTDKNARKATGSRQVAHNKESVRVPRGIWSSNRELED